MGSCSRKTSAKDSQPIILYVILNVHLQLRACAKRSESRITVGAE